MKYFECNLPVSAPAYVTEPGKREKLTELFKNVHARMDKLNNALDASGLTGEVFSKVVKPLFDQTKDDGSSILDSLSASNIAAYASSVSFGVTCEPRFEWPNADVVVDTAFVSTKEWEAIRTIGIGGSDAAVIMGTSPYRTEQELYHDKIGTEFVLNENRDMQFIFDYGHKLESLVIEEFCHRSGARVIPETRMFCKKGMPYITANIDAIVEMPDGTLNVFEAKTTTFFNKAAWASGSVPPQYIPQCRQYMSVLDDPRISRAYIGCIYGNTPDDYECSYIDRNMDLEQDQLDSLAVFWDAYVISGYEPESSGNVEKDLMLIRRQTGYADKSLPVMDLSDTYLSEMKEWMTLSAEKSIYQKKIDGISAKMKQLSTEVIKELGATTKGSIPLNDEKYIEVSYTPRGKTVIDEEKLRLSYPEAYKEVVKKQTDSFRVFSVKEKPIRKAKKTA